MTSPDNGAAALAAAAPLRGVRVLDLTRLFPFSYGTQFLVDLGAEVVKVEQPGGEVGRSYVGQYAAANRGKRSVTVDLRSSEGRDRFLALVADADVVVESFRPGYLDGLGLGFAELRRTRASLVMCSVSGYAVDSAMASAPGHDLNFYAVGSAALPVASGEPVVPAIPVVDMAIGLLASYSIAAGLAGVARGGPGAHIELSMADLGLSLGTSSLAFAASPPPQRAAPFPEFVLQQTPCYRLWRTADDRWISLCNVEPKFWKEFLNVVGRPDLEADQLAVGDRGQAVIGELATIIGARTAAEWHEEFAGREVCYAPVLSPDEAASLPDFLDRGLVRVVDGWPEVLFPGTFDGVRPARPLGLAAPGADDPTLG